MIEKRENNYQALLCDDCNVEIFVDDNMVMLNDKLWKEVSDKHEDSYCDCCIEKRMGRKIEVEDFKWSSAGIFSAFKGIIPCNAAWLWEKHRDKYLEIWPEHKKFDIDL